MIVLGRQKELIGPPQRGIIVDMMSYAYGNHWGTVGEPESFLSGHFYRITKKGQFFLKNQCFAIYTDLSLVTGLT